MNKNAPAAQNTNAPSLLRSLWLGTCSRYTLLCLILLVTSAIAADSLTITYVDSVRFFLLLPFGFCLNLAALTRRSTTLSTGAKCVLHPLSTLGGFYLFCYLPYQVRTKPSGMQVFIILLLVIILYAIVMGIYAAVASKQSRRRAEEIPYESQFSKS